MSSQKSALRAAPWFPGSALSAPICPYHLAEGPAYSVSLRKAAEFTRHTLLSPSPGGPPHVCRRQTGCSGLSSVIDCRFYPIFTLADLSPTSTVTPVNTHQTFTPYHIQLYVIFVTDLCSSHIAIPRQVTKYWQSTRVNSALCPACWTLDH